MTSPIYFFKAIKNQAGYYLYGNPPRWHKFDAGNPAPADAHKVVDHKAHVAAIEKLKEKHHASPNMSAEDMINEVSAEGEKIAAYKNAIARANDVKKKLLSGKNPQKNEVVWFWKAPEAKRKEVIDALMASGNEFAVNGIKQIIAEHDGGAPEQKPEPQKQAEPPSLKQKLKDLNGDELAAMDAADAYIAKNGKTAKTYQEVGDAMNDSGFQGLASTYTNTATKLNEADSGISAEAPQGDEKSRDTEDAPAPGFKPSYDDVVSLMGASHAEKLAKMQEWAAKMGGMSKVVDVIQEYQSNVKEESNKPKQENVKPKTIFAKQVEKKDFSVGDEIKGTDLRHLPPGSIVDAGEGMHKILVGRKGMWFNNKIKSKGDNLVWQSNPLAPQHIQGVATNGYGKMKVVSLGDSGWLPDTQKKVASDLLEVVKKENYPDAQAYMSGNDLVIGDASNPNSFKWVDESGKWGAGFTDKQKAKLTPEKLKPVSLGESAPKMEKKEEFIPDGWDGMPNGISTNTDPKTGGIIDKNAAGLGWFVIPNDNALVGELNGKNYFTKKEAYDALQSAINADKGPKEGDTKEGADGTLVFKDGRWHKQGEKESSADKAKAEWQAKMEANNTPVLELDGDSWYVLHQGAKSASGHVFVHLASKTKGTMQANGWNPAQEGHHVSADTLDAAMVKPKEANQPIANDWSVSEHVHTKTGEALPKVAVPQSVGKMSDDQYKAVAAKAKAHNGYWSKVAKGFLFHAPEDAKAFADELNGAAPAEKQTENEADKVWLMVPYTQKGDVKNAGAKWDSEKKLWYAIKKDGKINPILDSYIPSAQGVGVTTLKQKAEVAALNLSNETGQPYEAHSVTQPGVGTVGYYVASPDGKAADDYTEKQIKDWDKHGVVTDGEKPKAEPAKPQAKEEYKVTPSGYLEGKHGYAMGYSNLKQANATAAKMTAAGYDVHVTATHPFKIVVNANPGETSASVKPTDNGGPAVLNAKLALADYDFPPVSSNLTETAYAKIDAVKNAAKAGDIDTVESLLNKYASNDSNYANSSTNFAKLVLTKMKGKAGSDDGPKDGDTKQGADGQLVFMNGRWHKVKTAGDTTPDTAPKAESNTVESLAIPDLSGIANGAGWMNALTKLKDAVMEDPANMTMTVNAKLITFTNKKTGGKYKVYNPTFGYNLDEGQKKRLQFIFSLKSLSGGNVNKNVAEWLESQGLPVAMPAGKKPKKSKPKVVFTQPSKSVAPPVKSGTFKGAQVIDGWEKVGEQAGSNAGGKFRDGNGQDWYCKFPGNPDVVRNEFLAAKFYQMLGVSVPTLKLVEKDGKLGIASKWVDGMKMGNAEELAAAQGAHDAFAIDAWLANWDVVGLGNDNLMIGADGKAVRVDVGGSLVYRAQGEKKGDAFGDDVAELKTLIDPKMNPKSAAVFSGVNKDSMAWGLSQLNKLKPSQIEELVEKIGPGSEEDKAALSKKLIARRASILKAMGVRDQWDKAAVDESNLKIDPAQLPSPLNFSNWENSGKGLSSNDEINKVNSHDSQKLIEFAAKGDLAALKTYEYEEYDKNSGKFTGKKIPITEHKSQHIQKQWSALIQMLQSIAYPHVDALEMPSLGIGSTIEEVAAGAGSFAPDQNVTTIPAEQRLGYFMNLGHIDVDDAKALLNTQEWHWLKSGDSFTDKLKAAYKKAKSATKEYIQGVQSTGYVNHIWSQGKKVWQGNNIQTLTAGIYEDAVEIPAGAQLWRWMDDDTVGKEMTKQFLAAKPGAIIQNTDSMCASFHEHWGNGPHFTNHDGKEVLMRIRCAKGTLGTPTYGTGSLGSEGEITTMPGQRFVVVDIQKGGPKHPDGVFLDVIALPPDEGYLAQLGANMTLNKALKGKILLWTKTNASKLPRVLFPIHRVTSTLATQP